MKAKLLSLFLLAALVVPITATFIILKKQQKQVRKEVKWKMIAGIDKSELVLLKFKSSETGQLLDWKHSKEFQYSGEFYDVVETEFQNDSVFYWCWWDSKETELNAKLQSILLDNYQNNPEHQSKSQHFKSFIKTLFVEEHFILQTKFINKSKRQQYFTTQTIQTNMGLQPPSPPPQQFG